MQVLWIGMALAAAIPLYFLTYMIFELSGIGRVANSFLSAARQKNLVKAYKYLSKASKSHVNEQAFEVFLSRSAIVRSTQTKWQSRQIVNRRALLDGFICTEGGLVVPLKITLAKERGIWKVQSVHEENISLSSPDLEFAANMRSVNASAGADGPARLQARGPTPDDMQAAWEHYRQGTYLRRAGDLSGAIKEFQATIVCDPSCFPAYGDLGSALQALGDLKGAITAYRAVLRLQPDNVTAQSHLAMALESLGDRAGALAEMEVASRINPDYPPLHINRGLMRHKDGDLAGAVAEYKIALRLDPENADAHYNLGVIFMDRKDSQNAIAEFRAALRINPHYIGAHGNLGNLLRDQGDRQAAIAEYKALLRINPNEALGHYHLGLTFYELGRMDEALAEWQVALRLNPTYPNFHYAIGAIFEGKNNLTLALEHYRQARDLGLAEAKAATARLEKKLLRS
jgi:tetratricopeptide (TPR) repeat protein